MDGLIILSRFVHFGAVSLMFGGALFRLCVQPQNSEQQNELLRAIDIAAVVAALLSAVGWFVSVGASMAGDWTEIVEPEIIGALLVETRFGRLWIGRLALLAVIAALILAWRRRTRTREVTMLVLAGALIASLAGVGHGSVGVGWLGPVHLVADMTHMLCVATWLGGLVCLWVILHRAIVGGEAAVSLGEVQTLLPRFSRVGYVAVAALLITGCVNATILLAQPDALIWTDYGRVLLLKIGLVAVMVAIAIGNRLRFSPRILVASTPGDGRESISALYRSVAVEQGVGLVVLATTAVLGTIHPIP